MPSSNEDASDSDSDDGFKDDLEALGRACRLTGKGTTDNHLQLSRPNESASLEEESDGDEYGADDLQWVRSIEERFAVSTDLEDEPLSMKPLCMLPPDVSDSDDCEDDYETLRAIQRRFASYNDGGFKANVEDIASTSVKVGATIVSSEKESSNRFVERTNAREGFLNCVDVSEPHAQNSQANDDAGTRQTSDLVEWSGPITDNLDVFPVKSSCLPNSALAFVDAIKKNRSCQKLLRSKMMQMEARLEELKNLINRVKILKDFQAACKRKTGRALSQKKDPRVQLISPSKLRASKKFIENKIPAAYKGPPENMHVAGYKEALATFAVPVNQDKWSKEESENLLKGVKQQFQEKLLQQSVDLLGEADGSYDSCNIDSIFGSIKDLDVTPEKMRAFLPKVKWEQLAAMYVPARSGAECQARFLNYEDPLINRDNKWTAMEEKNLLHIVQQKGLSNWIEIAASLRTNRTPFQCLAHYQRSLNASILKSEWTEEEDDQLRSAVLTFGESNWQCVASVMEGRTGTQCSNRWLKTLHPARKRVGKWTAEEDKRLKVAVTLFGPKTWKKVASCVPGRTQVQCRERWVNCLDPSLNVTAWTEEEDFQLEAAISEHGYCWSKVAACIPHRTDSQCWRRWKTLFPDDVPRLQAARKIQKAALISNFVDRESEKPCLGPNDFKWPEGYLITGSEVGPSTRKKRGSRRKRTCKQIEMDDPSSEIGPEEIPRLTNGSLIENAEGSSRCSNSRGRGKNPHAKKKQHSTNNRLSPSPDTVLTNASNCEEIPISPVNDDNQDTSLKPEFHDHGCTTPSICDGNMMIDPHVDVYGQLHQTDDCLLEPLVYPHPEMENVGPHTGIRKKASKLQPRKRRNSRAVEEELSALPDRDTQNGTGTMVEKRKKRNWTEVTNDQLSHHPTSTSTSQNNIVKIKVGKRKRNTQEIGHNSDCASLAAAVDQNVIVNDAHVQTETLELLGQKSSFHVVEIAPDTDNAAGVSGNLEDLNIYSEGRNELQQQQSLPPTETEPDNPLLDSFLAEAESSSMLCKPSSKVNKNSQTAGVYLGNVPKRQRSRSGNRNSLPNHKAAEIEGESSDKGDVCMNDDMTIGEYLHRLKKRKADDDMTIGEYLHRLKKRKAEAPNK